MENQKVKKTFKQRLFHETTEYFINVIYLTLFFSAVIFYRRHLLAQHGIIVEDYFAGLIKALVIGKAIIIGEFLSISRKYENKALIIPIIYKSVLFTILAMLLDLIENYIKAFILNPDFAGAFIELTHHINSVWLATTILMCIVFLPFFALKELSRVTGREKFRGILLKHRD